MYVVVVEKLIIVESKNKQTQNRGVNPRSIKTNIKLLCPLFLRAVKAVVNLID